MNKFAFMLHPLDESDVSRKFPFARFLPDSLIAKALQLAPPFKASEITGVNSHYSRVDGCFVTCPLTAEQMMRLPQTYVINKIIKTGQLAEKLGAKILGLGAFTSIVGDAGISVAKKLRIPVTTGNSYTVATAIDGAKKAANLMGHDIKYANIVVIGASGSIGKVCSSLLAREVKNLTLVGRDESKLNRIASEILYDSGLVVHVELDIKKALKKADVVIAVTSSLESIIDPEDLKPGAVVCDVSRPRNVSKQVAELRNDVLVIEGGLVEVPGDVEFNLNFGFPPKTAYACMSETMILALENKWESFSLGRDISMNKVIEIEKLAQKHGFKVAGFRSFERAVSEQEILQIRNNAKAKELIGKLA